MSNFAELIGPSMDNIYRFKLNEEGQPIPPDVKLPKFVVERLNYFYPLQEEGLTFMGVLEMVLANDEEQAKKDFLFGAFDEWLPVSDEFKKWRDDYPLSKFHQMEIAVAILYGYVGQEY